MAGITKQELDSNLSTEITNKANTSDLSVRTGTTTPTLINNYANNDTVNAFPASYWKDALGNVHIRGELKVTTGGTDSTIPFWLANGYYPVKNLKFPITTNLSIACYVLVRSDGALIIYTPSNVASWINLGEIVFKVGE